MAFMTHPEHGATNTQDVEGHEKNGWKISTLKEWMGPKYRPESESGVTVAEQPVRNKPGRKPKGI
jgi:hypothetical protein